MIKKYYSSNLLTKLSIREEHMPKKKEYKIIGVLGTWKESGIAGGRILVEASEDTYWVLHASLKVPTERFLGKKINSSHVVEPNRVVAHKVSMKQAAQYLLTH